MVYRLENVRPLAPDELVYLSARNHRVYRNEDASILAHSQVEIFDFLPFKEIANFSAINNNASLDCIRHVLKPSERNRFDVFDNFVDPFKRQFQSTSFLIFIKEIVYILGYPIMDRFIVRPIDLTVSRDDLCDFFSNFRNEFRSNPTIFNLVEDCV
jgi:hypothetical protein